MGKSEKSWLIKLATSKITLSFLVAVLLIVCIFLCIALRSGTEIKIMNWLTLSPMNAETVKMLKQTIIQTRENSVSRGDYKRLEIEKKSLKIKLDKCVTENAKLTAQISTLNANIRELEDILEKIDQNTNISFHEINCELEMNGTINTKQRGKGLGRSKLYKHIQKCLSAIGYYDGEINGDQLTTCNALKHFQRCKGLMDDGIIGKKTWSAISASFEIEKMGFRIFGNHFIS